MELNVAHAQPPAPVPRHRMPDFAGGTAAHTHTVDSALVSLEALGIRAHRIRLRRVGRDARNAGEIVRQSPPAGSFLAGDTMIELDIAGLGFTQSLPVGMWDSGGEAVAGTREILWPFDDPLEKLRHWFGEGAPLFRLAPDDPGACARWLRLFGVDPQVWPETLWYRLASLISNVPQLACSEQGCAFAIGVLLGIPVRGFRYRPVFTALPAAAVSRLGARASRLGIDLLVGDVAEDLAVTVLEFGPVSLGVYEYFVETEAGAALLREVLSLLMPLGGTHTVEWLVQDPARPPELGRPERNARLGINSHMGDTAVRTPEANLDTRPDLLDAAPEVRGVLGGQR